MNKYSIAVIEDGDGWEASVYRHIPGTRSFDMVVRAYSPSRKWAVAFAKAWVGINRKAGKWPFCSAARVSP